ncbi:hypothetical protein GGQ74_000493 [Desulfobaculum xiamenense]|uniref:Uncharacterized protein n=1 Tax=Desulfobaculum xiamenense TaxID=995050 RepID=A0A846QKY9_9BACT|nr:hypothetical protein [Desulfobaculum xiamenense]
MISLVLKIALQQVTDEFPVLDVNEQFAYPLLIHV